MPVTLAQVEETLDNEVYIETIPWAKLPAFGRSNLYRRGKDRFLKSVFTAFEISERGPTQHLKNNSAQTEY